MSVPKLEWTPYRFWLVTEQSPNQFWDPRSDMGIRGSPFWFGDPQISLGIVVICIPKPIRGSPNQNGDPRIPISKWGSQNWFGDCSVTNQNWYGVHSNLGTNRFCPQIGTYWFGDPHTDSVTPQIDFQIEESQNWYEVHSDLETNISSPLFSHGQLCVDSGCEGRCHFPDKGGLHRTFRGEPLDISGLLLINGGNFGDGCEQQCLTSGNGGLHQDSVSIHLLATICWNCGILAIDGCGKGIVEMERWCCCAVIMG
jgi:hypothetical protein